MLKSHPFILLDKHIDSLIKYYMNFKSTKEDPDLLEVIEYHDWGKQNKFFQDRIEKIERNENAYRDIRRDKHAVLSSLKYMMLSHRNDICFLENLNMILGHHSSLRSFDLLLDIMYKYVEDSDIIESFKTIEDIDEIKLRESFFKLEDIWYGNKKIWTPENSVDIRIKFSQLVDADRLSAMRKSVFNREDLVERNFNKESLHYSKALGYDLNNSLDIIRSEVKLDINNLLKREKGTFTLTLPTGLGKTISAIRIAEKLKNKVIYVVPYLSIADQTWEVFNDIYKYRNHFGSWDFLVKHDSRLNETEYEKDEFDRDISVRDLIKNWHSKIVITTTVQFFDSLVSLNSGKLRKLHNTYGATILIDEPQAIPYEKWKFIKNIVDIYAKKLNWKVIYLSATPPTMSSDAINLVKNEEYLFSQLDRTEIKYLGRQGGYQGVKDWVNEAWKRTKDKNQILWLVNVEKLARKVFEHVQKLKLDYKLVFISGKLPPIIRSYKIKKLRQLMENGERVIVISTQVLEAGVDLDFDGVVRDLAPLPVLIQVAGRLNRRGTRKRETLYVMQLMENTVYSDFEFRHTGHVLYQRDNLILEKDYYKACKEYYELCEEMPPTETPEEWMEQFTYLRNCSMRMIESPDYETSAVCSNLNDWIRLLEYDEATEFYNLMKELTGYNYRDVYGVMLEISELENTINNSKEDVYDLMEELVRLKRYLGWFETTCNISDVEDYNIEDRKFYTMEIPISLLTF